MAKRPNWEEALARSGLMETLAGFDPRVAGTLPLGVATRASDIDVLAHAPDAHAVSALLIARHGREAGFFIRQWTTSDRPVIAGFVAHQRHSASAADLGTTPSSASASVACASISNQMR